MSTNVQAEEVYDGNNLDYSAREVLDMKFVIKSLCTITKMFPLKIICRGGIHRLYRLYGILTVRSGVQRFPA